MKTKANLSKKTNENHWKKYNISITTPKFTHSIKAQSRLVVLSEGDAIKKIGEQIGKTKFIDEDLTQK